MPKRGRFPALLVGPQAEPVPWHTHDPADIVGPFTDLVVTDIRSVHWDGGSDLSGGRDEYATTGYFLDSSAGAIQASTLFWRMGDATVYPQAAALTVTGVRPSPGESTAATATPSAAALAATVPQAGPLGVTRTLPAAAHLSTTAPQATMGLYPTVRSSSYGQCAGGIRLSGLYGWLALMPSTVEAGDLLIVVVGQDNGTPVGVPGGPFTELLSTLSGGVGMGVFWRTAQGSEDGTWLVVCTGADRETRFVCYAIRDCAVGAPEEAHQTGDSVNPDPPNLAPAGGSDRILWVAAQVNDRAYPGAYVTGWPTGYTMNQVNTYGGPFADVSVAACCRHLNAASENPGVFTLSAAEGWVAATVAVYPA